VKRLTPLLILLLALIPAGAFAQAADQPIVREIFTCKFNDDKDMADLMAARDFYLKQMEKAGMKPRQTFVWTSFKAPVDFDFLWASNYPDMITFAKESDAYLKSPEGQAADERFASVATCSSSLATRRLFFQAEGELNVDPAEGAVLNVGACNYRHGHGPEDLDDLVGHAGTIMGNAGVKDGFIAYVSVPDMGAGPNTRDFYLYGVNSSLEAWATRGKAMQAAAGIDSLRRHFRTIAQCGTALFFGREVVAPD
jgi:hypothetical protein